MAKSSGNTLVILLVIVLVIQVYIMLFRDPAAISREGLIESRILLQGRDPGVPEPVPGQEPEIDQKITVQKIGPEARPVVVPYVSHGEGQDMPMAPKSAFPKQPRVPGVPENMEATLSLEGSEDYYRLMVYGVVILQAEKDLALTPEQAKKMKTVFEMKNKVSDTVPESQRVLLETLTEEQLKYIYIQKCIQAGGSRPLSPEFIDEKAPEMEKVLKKRM